jgi:hypothetical protein
MIPLCDAHIRAATSDLPTPVGPANITTSFEDGACGFADAALELMEKRETADGFVRDIKYLPSQPCAVCDSMQRISV